MDCPNGGTPDLPRETDPNDFPLTAFQTVTVPTVAVSAALFLNSNYLGRFIILSGLSMQIHEFGHALVGWLGGRFAIPTPMQTLFFSLERSYVFAIGFLSFLLWLTKTSWDEDCRFFTALCATAIFLQIWMTLFLSLPTLQFWISFGGLGAECYVAALLIVLYFHRLPRAAHWPAYRVVFLFIGTCVLTASLLRWKAASIDFEKIPWGSFFGGDGDVEAMIDSGWTVNVLVKAYLRLSEVCVACVLLAWMIAAWPHRRLWRNPSKLLN